MDFQQLEKCLNELVKFNKHFEISAELGWQKADSEMNQFYGVFEIILLSVSKQTENVKAVCRFKSDNLTAKGFLTFSADGNNQEIDRLLIELPIKPPPEINWILQTVDLPAGVQIPEPYLVLQSEILGDQAGYSFKNTILTYHLDPTDLKWTEVHVPFHFKEEKIQADIPLVNGSVDLGDVNISSPLLPLQIYSKNEILYSSFKGLAGKFDWNGLSCRIAVEELADFPDHVALNIENPASHGLSDIGKAIGIGEVSGYLPQEFSDVIDGCFIKYIVLFFEKKGCNLNSALIALNWQNINVSGSQIKLHSVNLDLLFQLGKNNSLKDGAVEITVWATMTLFNQTWQVKFELKHGETLEDAIAVLTLAENEQVKLITFAEELHLPEIGLPDLTLTDIRMRSDLKNARFSMNGEVKGEWEVPSIGSNIEIERMYFTASSAGEIKIDGQMMFAGACFEMQGELPELRWKGSLIKGELSLKKVTSILSVKSLQLPDFMSDLLVTEASIDCDMLTGNMRFEVKADLAFNLGCELIEIHGTSAQLDYKEGEHSTEKICDIKTVGELTLLDEQFSYNGHFNRLEVKIGLKKTSTGDILLTTILEDYLGIDLTEFNELGFLNSCTMNEMEIQLNNHLFIKMAGVSKCSIPSVGEFTITGCEMQLNEPKDEQINAQLSFSGELTVGSGLISADLKIDIEDGDCQFRFDINQDKAVNLKDLIKNLLPDITDVIPDWKVSDLKMELTEDDVNFALNFGIHLGTWSVPGLPVEINVDVSQVHLSCMPHKTYFMVVGVLPIDTCQLAVVIDSDLNMKTQAVITNDEGWDIRAMIEELDCDASLILDILTDLHFYTAEVSYKHLDSKLDFSLGVEAEISLLAGACIKSESLKLSLVQSQMDNTFNITIIITGAMKHHQLGSISGALSLSVKGDNVEMLFDINEEGSEGIQIELPTVIENEPNPIVKILPQHIKFECDGIKEKKAAISFQSIVKVELENLPAFLGRRLADNIEGTLLIESSADNQKMVLRIDRLIKDILIPLPSIEIDNDGGEASLGEIILAVRNIELECSDPSSLSTEICLGLPKEINRVFGVDDKGEVKSNIFRSYKNNDSNSLIRIKVSLSDQGLSLLPTNLPFNAIQPDEKGNFKIELGEFGAFEFAIPKFTMDAQSGALSASGSFKKVGAKKLGIPLALFRPMFEEAGFGLPQGLEHITFEEISLLDDNDDFNVNAFKSMLENIDGINLPSDFWTLFDEGNDAANRLPEKLKSYFKFKLPDNFSFKIGITPDGGARIKISVSEERPICVLIPNQTGLLGIELSGFTLGEVLGGQLFLVKIDAKFDYFNYPELGLCLLPNVEAITPFLQKGTDIGTTIDIDGLTTLFSYQTSVPIPVPLFYNKLSFEHESLWGEKIYSEIRCPEPSLNPIEIGKMLGQFSNFASDKDYLIDTDIAIENTDLKFDVGLSYIRLPKALGSKVLGSPHKDVVNISAYTAIADMLNAMKSFNPIEALEYIPDEIRSGDLTADIFGLSTRLTWALASAEEWKKQRGLTKKFIEQPSIKNMTLKEKWPLAAGMRMAGGFEVPGLQGRCVVESHWIKEGESRSGGMQVLTLGFFDFIEGLLQLNVRMNFNTYTEKETKPSTEISLQGTISMKENVFANVTGVYNGAGVRIDTDLDILKTVPGCSARGAFHIRFGRENSFVGKVKSLSLGALNIQDAGLIVDAHQVAVSGTLGGIGATCKLIKSNSGLLSVYGSLRRSFKPLGNDSVVLDKLKFQLIEKNKGIEAKADAQISMFRISQRVNITFKDKLASFNLEGKFFNGLRTDLAVKVTDLFSTNWSTGATVKGNIHLSVLKAVETKIKSESSKKISTDFENKKGEFQKIFDGKVLVKESKSVELNECEKDKENNALLLRRTQQKREKEEEKKVKERQKIMKNPLLSDLLNEIEQLKKNIVKWSSDPAKKLHVRNARMQLRQKKKDLANNPAYFILCTFFETIDGIENEINKLNRRINAIAKEAREILDPALKKISMQFSAAEKSYNDAKSSLDDFVKNVPSFVSNIAKGHPLAFNIIQVSFETDFIAISKGRLEVQIQYSFNGINYTVNTSLIVDDFSKLHESVFALVYAEIVNISINMFNSTNVRPQRRARSVRRY